MVVCGFQNDLVSRGVKDKSLKAKSKDLSHKAKDLIESQGQGLDNLSLRPGTCPWRLQDWIGYSLDGQSLKSLSWGLSEENF